MYLPQHVEPNDPAALAAPMRARPLASIVRHGHDAPAADPI